DPMGLDGWDLRSPSGQWMGPTEEERRIAAEKVRRFGIGVVKGAVGLKDTVVGVGYGVKEIVTEPGEYWNDLKTVVANVPDAIAESGGKTYYEIKRDQGKVDEIGGEAALHFVLGV